MGAKSVDILTKAIVDDHNALVEMANTLSGDYIKENERAVGEYIASYQTLLCVLHMGAMLGSFAAMHEELLGKPGGSEFFDARIDGTMRYAMTRLAEPHIYPTWSEAWMAFDEGAGEEAREGSRLIIESLASALRELFGGASRDGSDGAETEGGDIMDMLAEKKEKESREDD